MKMASNQDVHRVDGDEVKYIQAVPVAYHEINSGDEINILDLLIVIVKRKNLFFIILLLCSLLGASFALYKPQVFVFSSYIEIGIMTQGGGFTPIEEPATVLEKINLVYAPLVVAQYLETNSDKNSIPELAVSLVKESSIIELTIKGIEDKKEIYFNFLNQISDKVTQQHKQKISVSFKNLELLKSKIEDNVAKLDSQRGLTDEEKFRLKKAYDTELAGVEIKMVNSKETKVIVKPMQSIKPVGQKKELIMIVSIVAGVFLALFAVFVFEFMERFRNYSAAKEQSV